MSIEVIHVLGASGSGATTLGRSIEQHYGYKHLDTDNYYWLSTDPPFTTPRKKEERIQLIKEDIEHYRKCIITGSLCGWGDYLIPYFDLVIRVVTPTEIRIQRLRQRELNRFGNRITEGGDMYKAHEEFITWASNYDTGDISGRSKALDDEWLKKISCTQIIIDGELPRNQIVSNLEAYLVHK